MYENPSVPIHGNSSMDWGGNTGVPTPVRRGVDIDGSTVVPIHLTKKCKNI